MMRSGGLSGESHTAHFGYWRGFDDPNSELPEPNDNQTGASASWTDRGLFDASYIRLKDVMLTYTLPQSTLDRLKLVNSVQISIQGHNLWLRDKVPYTFNVEGQTDYTGDPLAGGGLNYTSFPLPKEFLIKLSVVF